METSVTSSSMSDSPDHRTNTATLQWLIVAALATLVLSLIAANVPQAARKLILQYGLFGLVTGFALGRIAAQLIPQQKWNPMIITAIFVAAGGANIGWVSFQEFVEVRKQLASKEADQLAALNMAEDLARAQNDLQALQSYQKAREEYFPTFATYLEHRTSGFGKSSATWAKPFWIGELILAAVLGVFGFLMASSDAANPENDGKSDQIP